MQTNWRNPLRSLAILAIRCYRNSLGNMKLASCRYMPSCSEYAIQAIIRYGTLRGIALSAWRILRCNPFGRCGYDPVR